MAGPRWCTLRARVVLSFRAALETWAMSTPHKYPMISMREAMDVALSRASPLPEERVGFDDAIGRVLSSDVSAPRPHPPFPASIMDGYAVRAADCPGALAVVAASRAGAPTDTAVGPGQAAYITTGAPLPAGADAVVQVERVSVAGDVARVSDPVPVGANVRPLGSDVAEGETILPAGTLVGPHEIGVAALAGVAILPVRRRPRVAVLSTGDELADPQRCGGRIDSDASASQVGSFGRIFDANRPMLLAAAAEAGATTTDLGVARDDPEELAEAIRRAMEAGADVLVTSGGVSEGDKDHLKETMLRRGATIHFGRVMMKPGKPLTFAEFPSTTSTTGRMLAFGAPGNPVSAAVTFKLTVVPVLRRMMGWTDPRLRRVHATLGSDLVLDPERPEYHRATLEWCPRAAPAGLDGLLAGAADGDDDARDDAAALPVAHSTGRQISSRLTSMRGAEVLLELPRGPGRIRRGTTVSALVVGDLRASALQLPLVDPPVERPPERRRPATPTDPALRTIAVVLAAGNEEPEAAAATTAAAANVAPTGWRVETSSADDEDSAALADAVRLAAKRACVVVVAPVGEGGSTSAAAVVMATTRGFAGLAPKMRRVVSRRFDHENASQIELANEASGSGINAGQVDGAVVVSAPYEHVRDALEAGLGELLRSPYEEWKLTTTRDVPTP